MLTTSPPVAQPRKLTTFYILALTQIFSLIGSRMTGIAVGIWVFAETGAAAPLLIANFFAELPGMVGGSFTGIIVDKWDRRRVIALGDTGQAIGTLFLLTSLLSGQFQLWYLYLAMLIMGSFEVLQAPASDAVITMLVPESHRDRANGIKQLGHPLAGVVAPVLAGLLLGIIGLTGLIALDLITFAVAVVVVLRIHIPHPTLSEEGRELQTSFWRELSGGWIFLARRRTLLLFVIYIAFVFFLINGPLALAIPYLSVLTDNDEALIGVLLSVMNLGAFAGAATIAVMGRVRQRVRWIIVGYLLLGVALITTGIARQPVLVGVSLFFVFYPLPLGGALFNSFLQNKSPADLQGRLFAIIGQIFMLTTPFSFLITAALVDSWLEPAVGTDSWSTVAPIVGSDPGAGMGLLLVAIGMIITLTTLAIYLHPGVRHLETTLPEYPSEAENEEQSGIT